MGFHCCTRFGRVEANWFETLISFGGARPGTCDRGGYDGRAAADSDRGLNDGDECRMQVPALVSKDRAFQTARDRSSSSAGRSCPPHSVALPYEHARGERQPRFRALPAFQPPQTLCPEILTVLFLPTTSPKPARPKGPWRHYSRAKQSQFAHRSPPYSRKWAPRIILARGNNRHQVALMQIKLDYCGGGVSAGGAADG